MRKDEETVEMFMERFIREIMQIRDVPEIMKISSFMNGVRNTPLCEKLGEDFTETLDQLMDKVRAWVRGKDAGSKAREWEAKRVIPETKPRYKPSSNDKIQPKIQHERPRPTFSPYRTTRNEYQGNSPRYQLHNSAYRLSHTDHLNFTPLTKTPSEVLATEMSKLPFGKPLPHQKGSTDHPHDFCEYHRARGHRTYDCIHLKKEIETAVRSGRLSHLIRDIKHGIAKVDGKEKTKGEDGNARRHREEEQDAPLNIFAVVARHRVARIHVDGGSGSKVMYEHCFRRLDKGTQSLLKDENSPLVGFSGELAYPIGKITLPFTLREGEKERTIDLTFIVIKAESRYNAILERPGIRALRALTSTTHGMMKFPTSKGIETVKSSSEIIALINKGEGGTSRGNDKIEEWILNDRFPEQTVKIGKGLLDRWKTRLKEMLMRNMDVFAWEHIDKLGILRDQTEHFLNTHKWLEPVKQKK
ncbi:hypothetical protein L1987_33501 [Smallanthus sonchifolius]|uniref:Uncharacterized protein n=1 Tax=Smallanthus sonchifolius TaxID=185202 RepID=A0ACB9HSX1_9ASTR|nr:hypothetical protein L1987_33501 [Smallanthus sonchifolius]